jgi:hypothetical protein
VGVHDIREEAALGEQSTDHVSGRGGGPMTDPRVGQRLSHERRITTDDDDLMTSGRLLGRHVGEVALDAAEAV